MSEVHKHIKGWICSKCSGEFPSANSVVGHYPKCSNKRPSIAADKAHKCTYCIKSFDKKTGLGLHMKSAHPNEADLQAQRLTNKRVSPELIDLIVEARMAIPDWEADENKINIQIHQSLTTLHPTVAEDNDLTRIKNIRTKGKHSVTYRTKLAEYRRLLKNRLPPQQSRLEMYPEPDEQPDPSEPGNSEVPDDTTYGPPHPEVHPTSPGSGDTEQSEMAAQPNHSTLITTAATPIVSSHMDEMLPPNVSDHTGEDDLLQPTQPLTPVAVVPEGGEEQGRMPTPPLETGQGVDQQPPTSPDPSSDIVEVPQTAMGDGEDQESRPPPPPDEEPQTAQSPSETETVPGDGEDPGGSPPTPPDGDPTPPEDPISPAEDDPESPLEAAIREKLRTISAANTINPLARDLNTVVQECLQIIAWTPETKQCIHDKVEEVLRKHRPKIWEEPPPRRAPPRRDDNIPISGNRTARRKHRFAKAQRLFQRKPKELMRRDILEEGTQEDAYKPTTAEAFETYNGRFGVPSKEEEAEATPVGNHDLDLIWAPLTKKEIETALKSMPNSSAGPCYSKLDKGALKSIGSLALHRIFLIWQQMKDIPQWCKINRTILIPKKSVPRSINDFRPLTIGAHIARLFTRTFAARLTTNLPLHHRQKAFRPVDGCGENLALIEGIIADARKRSRPLYITFVDVAKAFDTVSHRSIERALCRLRCPKPFVTLTKNLYQGAQTKIHLDGVETEAIPITNGVKQGCPLSPLFFNSVIDELLHLIGEDGGYKLLHGGCIASMAFADDLILISSTREGMVKHLSMMDSFFQARGMKVQPPKCCTLGLEKKKGGGLMMDRKPFGLLDPTTGAHKNMTVMGPTDWTKYLGLEVGSAGLKNGTALRREGITALSEELNHLHKLPLKANQKIHMLRTYVIPKLQYKWTKGPAALNMLKEADKIIRSKVRTWLKVFHSVPNAFYQAPVSDGGLGVPSIQDLVTTGKARLHAKLCSSADPAVAYVARHLLWGKEVQRYAKRLDDFQLGGVESGSDLNRKVKERTRRTLQQSTRCKGAELFQEDPLGNSTITDAASKTGVTIDMIKLRTQTFPVKMSIRPTQGVNRNSYNTTCRGSGCTENQESISHVLQLCPSMQGLRLQRHDVVDQQCNKWITDKGFLSHKEPRVYSQVDGNVYKPDRLYVGPGSDTLYVLDWTVPYETTRQAMLHAEKAKERKYAPHKADILRAAREAFPGKTLNNVIFRGIAFGARGAILPSTRTFLHEKLGMSKRCISWIQHRVAQKSISMMKCFFADDRS